MQKAIFLDRDGVLIHNRSQYVRSWADVKIYPFTLHALAALARYPYRIFILTNQSAIGRGLLDPEQAAAINERLLTLIRADGGRIDALYLCPHAPWEGCECRKPRPGLIFQAQREFDLDLGQSWMIGDAFSDMQAASNAGVGNRIMLQSGRGKKQYQEHNRELEKMGLRVAKNIFAAVKTIESI